MQGRNVWSMHNWKGEMSGVKCPMGTVPVEDASLVADETVVRRECRWCSLALSCGVLSGLRRSDIFGDAPRTSPKIAQYTNSRYDSVTHNRPQNRRRRECSINETRPSVLCKLAYYVYH